VRGLKHPGRLRSLSAFALASVVFSSLGLLGFPAGKAGPVYGQQVAAQAGTWQLISPPVSVDPNGPPGNYGFQTIVVDASTPSTVYVGTCYQGLWKSTDSGGSWSKINTGSGGAMLDSGRLWALVIDPIDSQILYTTAGYGNGGILKSVDGGVDWTDVFSGSPAARQIGTSDIYSIAIDPLNANHLLAAFHYYWYGDHDSGLVQSTDAGATWTILDPVSGWSAGNAVWFLDSSTTWLVGSQNNGIWRTTNAGGSWTRVNTQPIAHGGINALYRDAQAGKLYLALWNQVNMSIDDGVTWQQFSSGLPYAAYGTIGSDGTNLYTAPSFPEANYIDGPWYALPVSGGTTWQPYSAQTTCSNGYCNGPVSMAYDAVNHIVYSSDWNAGVWQLQEDASGISTATPTPPSSTATPTATATPRSAGSHKPIATATPTAAATLQPTVTTTPTSTSTPTSTPRPRGHP
jgi:photosystem II stability/assembly factor-like uncharacterized protein